MRKSVLCGVLLLLFGKMVSAQQTLSLQECRDLAVKNNEELRECRGEDTDGRL